MMAKDGPYVEPGFTRKDVARQDSHFRLTDLKLTWLP
jgi:hypothetical protein